MNVSLRFQWDTNVPKSLTPDYSTRITRECSNVDARRVHLLAKEYARTLDLNWNIYLSTTKNCCPWWNSLGRHAIPNGSAIVDTWYCGSNYCTVLWAAGLKKALELLVEPSACNGLPSSSDIAAGCVGFTHRRLVCGPPSEHILQLLPPVPMDISPGLPFPSVHGKNIFTGVSGKKNNIHYSSFKFLW